MKRRIKLYEGHSKIVYEGTRPNTHILFFKDDITGFSAANREIIDGKGVLTNRISESIFTSLKNIGIATHFIERINMREQLVKAVEIIPIKFVIRNLAAGNFASRFGLPSGTKLPQSIIEFFYKDTELSYPMVSEEHVTAFGWANSIELDEMMQYAIRINDFLLGYFLGLDLQLVEFQLEFGRLHRENLMNIILSDELSPENILLYDAKKSQYLGNSFKTAKLPDFTEYKEIANKMNLIPNDIPPKDFTPFLVV